MAFLVSPLDRFRLQSFRGSLPLLSPVLTPSDGHILANIVCLPLRVVYRSGAFLFCEAQPVCFGDLFGRLIVDLAVHPTRRFSALLLPRLGSTLTSKEIRCPSDKFDNLIGSLGLIILVFFLHHLDMNDGRIGLSILNTAAGKIRPDMVALFFKGILCNVLVCGAVWLAWPSVRYRMPPRCRSARRFSQSHLPIGTMALRAIVARTAPGVVWRSMINPQAGGAAD
jgi:hypothetical protein